MKVVSHDRLDPKSLVMDVKITLYEAVSLLYGRYRLQPKLLYKPVLKRLKHPLNPALGLRTSRVYHHYAKFAQRTLKLALRLTTVQVIFYSRLFLGFIRLVTIHI